ncbi:hypothetical protein [Pedobacter caeni]|uniref:Outer membrane insertion C-terminal signal n=1 Tax=Pedobacter caeni TaxID=288992 RepID=A0A1M5MTJ3_9SPHI|nr:hypothetical protein [Pedobacter caeni]SHG80618.1 outer membrane insertion C-terminal signal [Pedobacter caeni]
MKTIITACLSLLFYINAGAQSNFYKISAGGGFGVTQSFTDVKKHSFGLAGYGVVDYYFTPFISAGIEGQMGQINGGDINNDPGKREFINSYKAFTFNGRIALGALIDYQKGGISNTLKGLYVGTGLGLVINSVNRSPIPNDDQTKPIVYYPGKPESKNILFPLNLGINLYFPDRSGFTRYILNVNYQGNLTIGEGLDGYDNSSVTFKSGNPDIYTYFSVGLRYQFGTLGLYNKTVF